LIAKESSQPEILHGVQLTKQIWKVPTLRQQARIRNEKCYYEDEGFTFRQERERQERTAIQGEWNRVLLVAENIVLYRILHGRLAGSQAQKRMKIGVERKQSYFDLDVVLASPEKQRSGMVKETGRQRNQKPDPSTVFR
jgi:hypothetical protein